MDDNIIPSHYVMPLYLKMLEIHSQFLQLHVKVQVLMEQF